jgi:hypothetical protein
MGGSMEEGAGARGDAGAGFERRLPRGPRDALMHFAEERIVVVVVVVVLWSRVGYIRGRRRGEARVGGNVWNGGSEQESESEGG